MKCKKYQNFKTYATSGRFVNFYKCCQDLLKIMEILLYLKILKIEVMLPIFEILTDLKQFMKFENYGNFIY